MKRKLFNAALFGAVLVAAPVSTFVSCADYDADITAINKQVEDLQTLVDQKETTIKQQIAALEAQDKALAEKDAELAKALADCKTNCAKELAQCKADCAAARALLQASIDDLKAALAAAEKKHGDDVADLMAKDSELQKGIDKANSDLKAVDDRLKLVEEGLLNTQTDVQNLVEGLTGVRGDIKTVKDELTRIENLINTKVAELTKTINDTKAELVGQIGANAELIQELTKVVDKNKKDFDEFKTSANGEIDKLKSENATLAGQINDLLGRVETLEDGLSNTQKDVMDLSEGLIELTTQVNALDTQVYKNTIAIVDLAARMIEAEAQIADAFNKLGLLAADLETYKVAQAAVDAAQDAALIEAVATLTKAEGDYDFTNINKAYKAALEAAKECADIAQANAQAYADANFYNKAKVDELVAALEAADAQRDADFQAWVEQVLNPGLAEVWDNLDELNEGLSNTQQDVFNLTEGLRQVTLQANENSAKIAEVEAAYKAADEKMAADFRAWIEQELNPAFVNAYAAIADLGAELSSEVKGFVLEPASYYEGIQAIEGTSYEYTKWNVSDALNPVQDGAYVQYCPSVTAHYHINPSAAKLSEKVENYSYAVLDRTNRGVNTELKPEITAVAQNSGMLDVTIKLGNAAANKTPQTHMDPSEVTVMALQYTNPAAKAENQVVTSDYAVLYLNPLREVSLVSAIDTDREIGEAAEFAEVDYIPYTATEAYDIEEHIKTKFGGENAVSLSDNKWPEGFTYRYTEVDGSKSYFNTSEDGKVMPVLPVDKAATTACIGKEVVIRIDVMHGEDVAEVGFYKLIITGEAVVETAPAVVADSLYAIACPDYTVPALSATLKLDNVWNQIAETTGEDVEVVKTKYAVSLTPEGKSLVPAQYTEYVSSDNRVLYKQYEGVGQMMMDKDATVVTWNVDYTDPGLDQLFTPTKDRKSITTYIRVRSINAISKDTYNEFYLPIVWAPKSIEDWGDSQDLSWTYTRVANQWQSNKVTREEAELRLYADLTTKDTPFVYDIPAKAMVNFDYAALQFVGTAKEFVNVKGGDIVPTDGHFRFIQHPVEDARFYDVVAADGVTDTYELTVSEDGKQLFAGRGKETPALLATISEQGVVKLENNAVSQLLLNAYEKEELGYGETLCARVGFEAKCCAGEVKVIDGDFDVRFIKPLTVKEDPITITDADDINNAGYITANLLDNIVAFNNYTLAERPFYMEENVFDVQVELGDIKDWKTNYNAAVDNFEKTLGENKIDNLFDYAYTDKGRVYGITYRNNTAVVSDFTVEVPVKVYYNWNDKAPVSKTVKLNVVRTKGNSNRR